MELPHTQVYEGDHGTAARHKKFVGVILTGGLALAATPDPFGPRNCGQFDVAAAELLLVPSPIKAAQIAPSNIRSFI